MSHVAYIGIGANLGDRRAHIRHACDLLRQTDGILSLKLSSLHETEPVGGPPGQGAYLNAAARIETLLDARMLLQTLLDVEARLGRQRSEKWGPRVIDLDLLLFDDEVIDTPGLTVPHPRMHERRFVLEPLAEIAADAIHPAAGMTIQELLGRLSGGEGMKGGCTGGAVRKPE
ncbi:MAG: 2-amino-4-hydroxy-6-hydroxymethyldihydropteridine diphosphokinase [Phycisphaerae bacterium]|nr:2-amino-4-hydroxy-6-hydroxymethyldihydropteridine diphosphokinase [Phycisphaerae bacterium]